MKGDFGSLDGLGGLVFLGGELGYFAELLN